VTVTCLSRVCSRSCWTRPHSRGHAHRGAHHRRCVVHFGGYFIAYSRFPGYKSYPVRTQISGWDPSFNAITGLNGSGKSNILDAICFALGLTDVKQVRNSLLVAVLFSDTTSSSFAYRTSRSLFTSVDKPVLPKPVSLSCSTTRIVRRAQWDWRIVSRLPLLDR